MGSKRHDRGCIRPTTLTHQLHGRSRQQRYSKLADWSYIRQCVETLRQTTEDANMAPVPIFGNGDCYSAQSYYEEKEVGSHHD